MRNIRGLQTLISDYDAILVDAWGVIHDGGACFAAARDCLEQLKRREIPVIVLSNAARREAAMREELNRCGIDPGLYHSVLSSGELVKFQSICLITIM